MLGTNPEGDPEVFLYDAETNDLIQVTNNSEQEGEVTISGDGSKVAFASTDDITGENPEGQLEIFLYDVATSAFTQLTESGTLGLFNGFSNVQLSADGTRLIFESDSDFTGDNPDENPEIFLLEVVGQTLTQISDTDGGPGGFDEFSYDPSFTKSATKVFYASTGDPTGGNPNGFTQFYTYDIANQTITQLSSFTSDVNTDDPAVSDDESLVVFYDDGNPTNENPDLGSELFLLNTTNSTITQITNVNGSQNVSQTISSDGSRRCVYVRCRCDRR